MITEKDKKDIIKSELRSLHAQKYRVELQCRALKNTCQEDSLKQRTELLANIEGQLDFYNKELKSLK
jgi:hypothetical protein